MKVKLKPLDQQVIVITGATSGIGLVTARMAAKSGAKLVLAARDEESLRKVVQEIESNGGQAIYVVADVGDEEAVKGIASAAVEQFGRFDTWVNNAGMAIYGRLIATPTEDNRRLFDTNFWGIVYGSTEAARHFQSLTGQSEFGGAIINLGSTVSDRGIPVQGMYATTKHAVKGYTDALRMELEHDLVPVSVTLIKPAAIGTPFPQHARNLMTEEPSLPPPVYAPELVAEAILHSAQVPARDIFVGGGGKSLSMLGTYVPGLGDKILGAGGGIFKLQKKDEKARDRPDSLYEPGFGMQERGDLPERTILESSAYTKLMMHPMLKKALAVGAGLATLALVAKARR